MCGIVGLVSATPVLDAEVDAVVRMRDTLTHRGPDDAGIWRSPDGRVVLGHRRLSIVDVSHAGVQPMANEDGSVWITYNGEVYNHADLRHRLEARHDYRSRTDTETIVHLYEEKGVDCLHELFGMFAFGLWDERRQRLFLARDRIGIKPLYYTSVGGRFLFASEIKALLAHPAVRAELDPQGLYDYLTFLSVPAPRTLFAGISKLPAGHCATLQPGGALRVERWWDAIVPAQAEQDDRERAAHILELLRDSVRLRMMSDVPFGVLLSGGVDSTTNVALMAELMDRPVETFTVGFEGHDEYTEFDEARCTARAFATNHHEVAIGLGDLVQFLPDLVHFQDEPIGDPVCVPLHFVAKLAKSSGTTVVQVGEGADELFYGYRGYERMLLARRREWRALRSLPAAAQRRLERPLVNILRRTGRSQFADFVRRGVAGEELFWGGAITFYEADKQPLITEHLRRQVTSSSAIVDSHYAVIDGAKEADFLERMTYLELKQRLPELLLMRVDKMTMANSVEARVPFLDHRLVEYSMGLPMEAKVHGGRKHLLKLAVKGLVPQEVLDRPKRGFGVPVSAWFRGELGTLFDKAQASTGLRDLGLLDFSVVDGLLADHRSGRVDAGMQLWVLLNLFLWFDAWIGGGIRT